eukprot:8337091-Pyramimonas_sp.AAC.1
MTSVSYEAVRRAWEQNEAARVENARLALDRMEAIMVEAYKQHRGGPGRVGRRAASHTNEYPLARLLRTSYQRSSLLGVCASDTPPPFLEVPGWNIIVIYQPLRRGSRRPAPL